jgi:ribose/xylose/arabinose/galactoside ABC-type transport system permease subunit
VVVGLLLTSGHVAWPFALLIGLGTGLLVGAVNGVLIEIFGMNPLVTTLGTWWLASGVALGITQGKTPFDFPSGFNQLGGTTLAGVLIPVWYAVVMAACGGVVLSLTKFGWHVFATGGDREAARLSGVKIVTIGVVLYAASGLLAGAGGILFAARLGSAPANDFSGLALTVIAAAVIGGSSLSGGRGSMVSAMLGLLLLTMLGNAAIYVGISTYWTTAISGVVLLSAIAADAVSARSDAGAGKTHHRVWQALVTARRGPG